jgi:hypothetical protein
MRFPERSRLLPLLAACLPLVAVCGEQATEARAPAAAAATASGTQVSSDAPAPESLDVTVAGRVLDDESGEGVAGGYVIVLAPGVSFDDWERSPGEEVEGLMAGAAVTDSLGRYEVADLPRGSDFTVVVAARGHAPAVFESGLTVKPDDPPITRLADVRLDPQ